MMLLKWRTLLLIMFIFKDMYIRFEVLNTLVRFKNSKRFPLLTENI